MISHPPPEMEHPRSINNFCRGSVSCTAIKCIALFPNWVSLGQSFQYVLVFNLTNMHTMSHKSDFFACCSRVNIEEPTFRCTITFLSAATQVGFERFLNSTAMSDSISLHNLMLKVMISSKSERVLIRDLSDLTLQIVFNAWCPSMDVGAKCPIARKNSRHTSSWRFFLHCRIEETGSHGIICIICHYVLCHPSRHGTCSLGKHLPAKAHITILNESTEWEVTGLRSSTVDETVLASLNR